MLTRSGWAVAAGAVAALVVGRLFGVTELYVLAAVALVAVAAAMAAVAAARADVAVSRRASPGRMTAHQPGRVDVRLHNRGRRTRLPCTVREPVSGTLGVQLTVGPLGADEETVASYRVPTTRRGLVSVGPLQVELVDPLGLARRRVASAPRLDLVVLPAPRPGAGAEASDGHREPVAEAGAQRAVTAGPAEVATLRPYVVGDDLRRVHWPSSAHSGELQVRNDDQRWQGEVAVLLDNRATTTDEAGFEVLVSTAAGTVHEVAATGDRIRLLFTDGTDSGLVDARRTAPALLEQLALVTQHDPAATTWPAPGARRHDRLLVVAPPADRSSLRAQLEPLGYQVRMVGGSPADAPGGSDRG